MRSIYFTVYFSLVSVFSNAQILEDIKARVEYIKSILPLAEKGDANAQYILGHYYAADRESNGICRDSALKWLNKANEQNNVCAQYYLAIRYDIPADKKVRKKIIENAKEIIAALADKNDLQAQLLMLKIIAEDGDTKHSLKENKLKDFVRIIKMAAENGDQSSQFKLYEFCNYPNSGFFETYAEYDYRNWRNCFGYPNQYIEKLFSPTKEEGLYWLKKLIQQPVYFYTKNDDYRYTKERTKHYESISIRIAKGCIELYNKENKNNYLQKASDFLSLSIKNETGTYTTSEVIRTLEEKQYTNNIVFSLHDLALDKVDVEYRGHIKQGKPDGNGIVIVDADTMKSSWKEGEPQNGFGYKSYKGGDRYMGQFKNGFRAGKGTYKYGDASTYLTCSWIDGKIANGYSEWTWKNGSNYKGYLVNSKYDGKGILTYADGKKFEGTWKEGKPYTGNGIYFNSDNSYEGKYINGLEEGEGTFKWFDGEIVKGVFTHGKNAQVEAMVDAKMKKLKDIIIENNRYKGATVYFFCEDPKNVSEKYAGKIILSIKSTTGSISVYMTLDKPFSSASHHFYSRGGQKHPYYTFKQDIQYKGCYDYGSLGGAVESNALPEGNYNFEIRHSDGSLYWSNNFTINKGNSCVLINYFSEPDVDSKHLEVK
jgi:hypothetical protein